MFTWVYAVSELMRRRGRAVATALGLAVGVGLVAAVGALSAGLSDAQDEVLAPLRSIGTDISVSRPLEFEQGGFQPGRGGANLTDEERAQLEEENQAARLDFNDLGDPGDPFELDTFGSFGQLSFPESEATTVAGVQGVAQVAPSLSLNWIHVEGTVPEQTTDQTQGPGGPGGPGGGGVPRIGGGAGFQPKTISGIDRSAAELALVTPEQITDGAYFSSGAAGKRQLVVSDSYAASEDVAVGDEITLDDRTFTVVGIASPPLGGESSDLYVDLDVLQRMSDRQGRINGLRVSADDGADVDAVAAGIESAFPGSSATTASDLAGSVKGSLSNAKDLVDSLGTGLAILALIASVTLASLLMLGAVARRTRELGTLKAIGWPGSLLVRQISMEALIVGVLGGILGIVFGAIASLVIGALGITLDASAESVGGGIFGAGGPPGAPGAEQAAEATREITLSAPLDPALIGLAIVLAIAGALVAGAVAAGRIARLRPAAALRNVE